MVVGFILVVACLVGIAVIRRLALHAIRHAPDPTVDQLIAGHRKCPVCRSRDCDMEHGA